MKRKIISCAIFKPYIELIETQNNLFFDVEYLDIKQHDKPKQLNALLQEKINESKAVDEILLLYGLCGNAILNLVANDIPVRILKVHDCAMVLSGTRERYKKLFSNNLSQAYACASYNSLDSYHNYKVSLEYLRLVDQYGQENADYVLETLYRPKSDTIFYFNYHLKEDEKEIKKYDQDKLIIMDGQLTMLKDVLLNKDYKDSELLKTNEYIDPIYDLEDVFVIKQK